MHELLSDQDHAMYVERVSLVHLKHDVVFGVVASRDVDLEDVQWELRVVCWNPLWWMWW